MTSGLYIHVPFCENICDYCDFYSVVEGEEKRDQYVGAVCKELIDRAKNAGPIDTIYFGGGSPGLLEASQVEVLIRTVKQQYQVPNNLEVTLECNTESTTAVSLREFDQAGINRVSLGVQSYNKGLVRTLGRRRTKEPSKIIKDAIKIFSQISLDFILNIPGQTRSMIEADMNKIPNEVGHLAVYDLTIYPQTRLALQVDSGNLSLNSEKVEEELESQLLKSLAQKGYRRYEVSNFSKNNEESKHNLHYWSYDDYIGVGAGAVSTITGQRVTNSKLNNYLSGKRVARIEQLPDHIVKQEWVMMNLRLVSGFSRERYAQRFGVDFIDEFTPALSKMGDFFNVSKEQVSLTSRGLQLHHSVLAAFDF